MKKLIAAAMVGASLFALAGCRQTTATGNESAAADNAAAPAAASADAISGTWKADLDSVKFDQKPDELLLSAGRYSCKTCVPPIDVAADGSFHPISAPYADSMAVKVVDDHSVVRTSKK